MWVNGEIVSPEITLADLCTVQTGLVDVAVHVCYDTKKLILLDVVASPDTSKEGESSGSFWRSVDAERHIDSNVTTEGHNSGPTVASVGVNRINSRKLLCRVFLLEKLCDKKYNSMIKWYGSNNGTFKIVDAKSLSKLWGSQKGNPRMVYDNFSRAVRSNYRHGLISKVKGKNFCYKYNWPAGNIMRIPFTEISHLKNGLPNGFVAAVAEMLREKEKPPKNANRPPAIGNLKASLSEILERISNLEQSVHAMQMKFKDYLHNSSG